MNTVVTTVALASALIGATAVAGMAQSLCQGYGPQTPRDIASVEGSNARVFTLAPAPSAMNLCNIHGHTNAEHKGPGFSVFAGTGEHGGYKCNDSGSLTAAELEDHNAGHGAFGGIKPGDTFEVHWVYSSCDVAPGPGLGSCLSESCSNPELRVESQVFLLVNDESAINFLDYVNANGNAEGYNQPLALPEGTGDPVVFAGSTTGPRYTQTACSPLQVTWSVRPNCARLDINSLHEWARQGNAFEENHAHGVRQLVTAPELLSQIR